MYLRFSNIVRVIIVELWIILEFPFIGGFWRPVSLIHQLEGHLFYSHLFFFLATVNTDALNLYPQVYVRTFVFASPWQIPRSELSGSLWYSLFNFWETAKLFFKMTPPFYIPPAIYEWPCSSVSSPTLVIVCLFFFKFYLISHVWVICLHVCLCTMCPQYLKEDIRSPIIGVVDGYELPCGCRELKLFWKSNQCY